MNNSFLKPVMQHLCLLWTLFLSLKGIDAGTACGRSWKLTETSSLKTKLANVLALQQHNDKQTKHQQYGSRYNKTKTTVATQLRDTVHFFRAPQFRKSGTFFSLSYSPKALKHPPVQHPRLPESPFPSRCVSISIPSIAIHRDCSLLNLSRSWP